MAKYEVRIKYTFENTHIVTTGNREEAKRMVEEDYDLILGDNIRTTHGDDKVTGQSFGIHPESQILSTKETGRKARVKYITMNFGNRIEKLRNDIIEAVRQLLQAYLPAELAFMNREDDLVWIIWFGKNGDPCECRVMGVRIMEGSLTATAEEEESGDEVEYYGPFELGARNIDWLHEMYDTARWQLEETKDTEPKTGKP